MAKNNERNRNATNMNADTGESLGAVGGGAAGASAGTVLGPLGTVGGGLAGSALGNQLGEYDEENQGATNRNKQNKQQ